MPQVLAPRKRKEIDHEIRAMRDAGKRIRASKETARSFLIKHGYLTKDGKLASRYR
jgi:hypothetical protein